MRLKRIRLKNIRSYTDADIMFPGRTTLLSGNIGSGKSTILLAIDFVLFGLQRGNLTGASLLRNGTDEGSVELTFDIDEREIVLCRKLKRSKSSVVQDSGYIIKDDVKEEKTAIELRQMILELLHYPPDLLTKSKSLIYRYTVYTPQEEMKTILLGNKEDRIETLRKVFGIDKYKRIKNNSKEIVSALKSKKKELQGMSSDIEEKRASMAKMELQLVESQQKLLELKPRVESAQRAVQDRKKDIIIIEEQMQKMQNVKKELHGIEVEQENKMSLLKRKRSDKEELERVLTSLRQEDLTLPEENINLEEQKNKIKRIEARQIKLRNQIQEWKTLQNSSKQTIEKISQLSSCPTCLQDVPSVHKQTILDKESDKINDFEEGIAQHQEQLDQQSLLIEELKKEVEQIQKKQQQATLIRLKTKTLAEKETQSHLLDKELSSLKAKIGELSEKKMKLFSELEQYKETEKIYPGLKKALEEAQEKTKKLEMEKVSIESSMRPIEENIRMLREDISRKEEAKRRASYLSQLQFWLEEHFMQLMDTMEKNMMLKVHQDFNSIFTSWFGIMIDNDILKMELDEEFSPRIEQNGYDIEYEHLSGGEKTAAALAYRLALNQVVNNIMSDIKTKDLLILDEPTDGFSSTQLDKMRDVLEELDIGQIILVSHEAKVETFVDNVIRLEKENHVSKIFLN